MGLTLQESAGRAGGHCWVERRAFEVFGGWGAAVSDPAVKLLLDRLSLHSAWRAGQWWERLPVMAGVEREDLVVPPPGWERLLGAAGAHAKAGDSDAEVLTVAARVVLARIVARYRAHRQDASEVADASAIRTLGHAGSDAHADWEAAEAVLQGLLVDGEAVAAAAAALAGAEALLVAGP